MISYGLAWSQSSYLALFACLTGDTFSVNKNLCQCDALRRLLVPQPCLCERNPSTFAAYIHLSEKKDPTRDGNRAYSGRKSCA
jgi:hypothetical protein